MASSPKDIARQTLGPVMVGTFLNNLLGGVVIMQLYTYFCKSKSDGIVIKLLVIICAALNLTTAILDCISTYEYAVLGFGNVPNLFVHTKALDASFTIMVFPSTCIQCFFGWRVMRLTQRLWVLVVVGIGAAGQCALCFATLAVAMRTNSFKKASLLRPYLLGWWCTATGVDLLISTNLIVWFQTRRTGFQETDDLLNRLTRLTIRTCAMVTIWHTVAIFTYTLLSNSTSVLFVISMPTLYVITLLSSLNSRYYNPQSNELHWSDEPGNMAHPVSPASTGAKLDHVSEHGGESEHVPR